MRRKDREMNREFALEVIDKSEYGVLGMIDSGRPYTVVLSIIRDSDTLYFHSAKSGKKVDLFSENDYVSVSFISHVKVPNLFTVEQIQSMINSGDFASIGSKVFTTEFKSAHVKGRISEVTNVEEKTNALINICKKYTPDFVELALPFIENSYNRTAVYKIDIEEIHGKRKAFDSMGEELKWGRNEDES